jgi:hypothetical protein
MDKLYVLVGKDPHTFSFTIVESWEKLPTQRAVDKLIEEHESKYSEFALLHDLLFIEGKASNTSGWFEL